MTDTTSDEETKRFEGYLIVDWKDEEMRYRKTEPTGASPTELAIPVGIDVRVPSVQVPSIEAAIDVPATKVEQSVIEETREEARERDLLENDAE